MPALQRSPNVAPWVCRGTVTLVLIRLGISPCEDGAAIWLELLQSETTAFSSVNTSPRAMRVAFGKCLPVAQSAAASGDPPSRVIENMWTSSSDETAKISLRPLACPDAESRFPVAIPDETSRGEVTRRDPVEPNEMVPELLVPHDQDITSIGSVFLPASMSSRNKTSEAAKAAGAAAKALSAKITPGILSFKIHSPGLGAFFYHATMNYNCIIGIVQRKL